MISGRKGVATRSPFSPAWGTVNFEGGGCLGLRGTLSARGSWTAMGDDEWELNISGT